MIIRGKSPDSSLIEALSHLSPYCKVIIVPDKIMSADPMLTLSMGSLPTGIGIIKQYLLFGASGACLWVFRMVVISYRPL